MFHTFLQNFKQFSLVQSWLSYGKVLKIIASTVVSKDCIYCRFKTALFGKNFLAILYNFIMGWIIVFNKEIFYRFSHKFCQFERYKCETY